MSEYPPPEYLPFSQPPVFNPIDYPSVDNIVNNDISLTVGEADSRYLRKIQNDSSAFDLSVKNLTSQINVNTTNLSVSGGITTNTLSSTGITTNTLSSTGITTNTLSSTGITATTLSTNSITFSNDSYKQSVYSGANILYSVNGTDGVYLQVSLTLDAGVWMLSYTGSTIWLYQSSPTIVYLSTADSAQPVSTVKANLVPNSQTTYKGSGSSGVNTYFAVSNNVIVSPSTTTSYYLYASLNTTTAGPPVVYNQDMSGGLPNPDGVIKLIAIRIR
jgi:hypothetical protein